MLVVVEVVLLLRQITSTPRNFISVQTDMMGGFVHISVIRQHPPSYHHRVEIIQLVLILVLNLVFQTEMVKVVWVLETPNSSTRRLIVGLIVAILCHLVVGIIHT